MRKDIQALRAIAVLIVIVYHFFPKYLQSGYIGVDIFFVISGYLMTKTLLTKLHNRKVTVDPIAPQKAKINRGETLFVVKDFYARRIRRIIPMQTVVFSVIIIATLFLQNVDAKVKNFNDIFMSALFFQNWNLLGEKTSYLGGTQEFSVSEHFWSLSIEEQFYFAWPLILIVIIFIVCRFSRKAKVVQRFEIVVISIASIASIAFCLVLVSHNVDEAYFNTFSRVWELMIGGIVAAIPFEKASKHYIGMQWCGFVMIIASLFIINQDTIFPSLITLLPVVGTALIIAVNNDYVKEIRGSFDYVFGFKPIQFIGDISYSLYLWHIPVLLLIPELFGFESGTAFKLGAVVITFILSVLSYFFVEQTFRKAKIFTQKYWTVYLVGAIFTAIILISSLTFCNIAKAEQIDNLKRLEELINEQDDEPEPEPVKPAPKPEQPKPNPTPAKPAVNCVGAMAIVNKCEGAYGKKDASLTDAMSYKMGREGMTTLTQNDRYFALEDEAYHDITAVTKVGALGSANKIVLWGDSHSDMYLPTFEKLGKEKNIEVNQLYSKCVNILFFSGEELCEQRNEWAKEYVITNKIKTVVFSLFWNYYASAPHGVGGLIDTIAQLSNVGVKVYLMQDIPSYEDPQYSDCIKRQCKIPLASVQDEMSFVYNNVTEIKNMVNFVNIEDVYCNPADKMCYNFIGGIPVYNDIEVGMKNIHINSVFAQTLAGYLAGKLGL